MSKLTIEQKADIAWLKKLNASRPKSGRETRLVKKGSLPTITQQAPVQQAPVFVARPKSAREARQSFGKLWR